MVSKKKRVTKDLFHVIMKTGRVISSPLFLFRYIPQKDVKVAFVASKSIAKSAVERNNMRRRGYNTIRNIPLQNIACIFFYKKEAKKANFEEIKTEVENILKRVKI